MKSKILSLLFLAVFIPITGMAERRGVKPPPFIVTGDADFWNFVTMQGTLNGAAANFRGDLTASGECSFGDNLYLGRKLMLGNTTPHPSAMLQIDSSNGGILFPRMTQAQRNAIPSPANGLMVYQTDGVPGFYGRENGAWRRMTTM